MKTYIVAIPTKKTDEVNWHLPLQRYISAVYGETNEYSLDIAGFDKLRKDLQGVNADSTGMKLYFKYYSQLELLDLRIPFNQISSKKMSFIWYDAFQRTINHKQHSLPFEKANILFNIGSILSRFACQKYEAFDLSKEESEEDFKKILQLFQQAAGVFEFISENFLHAPSNDLDQSTLLFFKKLMLALSQELFVLKVITGDLAQQKNSLIAKLCSSAAEQYAECSKLIDNSVSEGFSSSDYELIDEQEEEEELEPILDFDPNATKSTNKITIKLDLLWTALIHFKSIYYKSLSYYFNGLQLEANSKYGDAIAYLSKSQDILNEISTLTIKQISKAGTHGVFEVLDNYKYHKDALSIKITELNKDNDLIYHDIIPSLVTLPEIKALNSTKIIPMNQIKLFNDINDHNYENFLKNVVPIDTHELLSYYSEEKSQFLRNELDMVDVSNEELASVLEYLKMPKALVTLKESINESGPSSSTSGSDLIDQLVLLKVSEIHQNFSADQSNRSQIVDIRKQIYSIISDIERRTTGPVGSQYKEDTIMVKRSLYEATNNDEKTFKLINVDNSDLYNILGKGPTSPEFKSLFEVTSTKSNPENEVSLLDIVDTPANSANSIQVQIKKLEDILYDLNLIKSNKQKLVETLKSEIHNDDISDIIVLNSKIKTTNEIKNTIFPEELKKFDPYSAELDKLNQSQAKFISDLKKEWESLQTNPKVKEIQSSKSFKQNLLQDQVSRINNFYERNWKPFTSGLKQGVQFYRKLLGFTQNLQSNVYKQETDSLSDQFKSFDISQSNTGYSQSPYSVPQQHTPNAYQSVPNRSITRSSTSSGGYDRPAPMLPPKQAQYPQDPYSSRQNSFSQPPQQGFFQPQAPPKPPQPQRESLYSSGRSDSSLIYDQPSTYNPDMYNFFSKE